MSCYEYGILFDTPNIDMVKKYSKRIVVILLLFTINIAGFLAAKYYFTNQTSNTNGFQTEILDKVKQNGPVLVHPSDFLQFGLDVLRNLGK